MLHCWGKWRVDLELFRRRGRIRDRGGVGDRYMAPEGEMQDSLGEQGGDVGTWGGASDAETVITSISWN